MHRTLAFLLPLGALLAQSPSVTVVAATPIGAMTTAGGATTFQGVPQGQTIAGSPNNVFLMTSQAPAGASANASTICYPTMATASGVGINFFERATARGALTDAAGSTAGTAAAGASYGPHAILATFHAAPGTIGRIVVDFRCSTAATGTTGVAIDVGNDGIVEVSSAVAVSQSIPFTFGASGSVTVRAANECRSTGDGTTTSHYSWTELYLSFRPDLTATCTFTNYGQGCGPQAAGGDVVIGQNRVVSLLATGCFPNQMVVVASGAQQLNFGLPIGCNLLTTIEDLRFQTADGAGNATCSWTVPVTLVGTTFNQAFAFDVVAGQLVLAASNGVRIDCIR